MTRLTSPALAALVLAAAIAPAADAGERSCPALQATLQQAMVGIVIERGEAAQLLVRAAPDADVDPGAPPQVSGGNVAYRRALQRALRSLRAQGCAPDLARPLVVRVVDPWGRGPGGAPATMEAKAGR